ncbi:hypothetical protein [Anaeroselena agilis]|uniref:Uncharacterized protein n=1 Tax=Anaeroselena agilis TaxID=3063788 RepID=A0ABU3NYU1_9FIRM|nr:hypothetical protein [Selenomonadales bacterium 4137-cl]
MLLGLSAADARTISRGILILVFAIAAGVVVADNQLNRLTARHEFGQALNVRREASGYYRAYVLGQSWGVRAVYPVGSISANGDSLSLEVAGRRLTVPTVVRVELDRAVYWLVVWRGQFVAAAVRTKRELAGYWGELRPLVRELMDAVKR